MKKIIVGLFLFLFTHTLHAAMQFDGINDQMNATLNSSTQPYSVSFWIYLTTIPITNEEIVSLGTIASGNRPRFEFATNGRFLMEIGSSRFMYSNRVFNSNDLNTPFHIAFVVPTVDASTFNLYINGVTSNTSGGGFFSNTGAANSISTTCVIGREISGNFPFKGTLDDVRIYSKSLSSQEVQSLALSACRLNMTDSSLGWWKLDDGIDGATAGGATVRDYSGNGSIGTPTNGPIWKASTFINYP